MKLLDRDFFAGELTRQIYFSKVLLFKFQTTSFFLSVFLRRQLRMHTALNLIKAPLKKCQTGILKYSACILKERNQNGYLLVEWQAEAQQYEQKRHGGHKLKQFFIKKSLEKGLPPFQLYGVALLNLRQLIAHTCRTGHQICKMHAQYERSFSEMISRRAHQRRVNSMCGRVEG